MIRDPRAGTLNSKVSVGETLQHKANGNVREQYSPFKPERVYRIASQCGDEHYITAITGFPGYNINLTMPWH